MPYLPTGNLAGQQAAMDAFTGKRKPAKPTMTTGQVLTGQMAQFDPKKSQDSAGGMGMPTPNVPGVATGAGAAGAEAARQKMTQPAGGLGNMMGGAGAQPPPAPPPGKQGLDMGLGGGVGDGAVEGGNQQHQLGADTAEALRVRDMQDKWKAADVGLDKDNSVYQDGKAFVSPGDQQSGAMGGQGMQGFDRNQDAAQQLEAERATMTEAEQRLWDDLMNDNGGMSKEEREAKMAALAAGRDAARERLNRAQGAAGGESALQVIGGGAADYNYQQGVGSIEKEAYDRKMQAINQAAGLAESAASREERQANAFDEAQSYFGEKGYTVTADGKLIGPDGKPVDTNTLTGEDRETYERFMYEMGAENPTSKKDKETASTATKTAKTERDKAQKNYASAKNEMKEIDKQIKEKQDFLDGLGEGQSSPQVESEMAELQKLRDTLAAGVAEAEKDFKEADAAYKQAATDSGDSYENGRLFSA